LRCHIITKYNGDKNGKYSTRRFTMLSFLKKIFGSQPAETPAPYKIETPVATKPAEFPFPSTKPVASKPAKPKAEKKPAVKAKPARKPKAPK
jgi:hypothetical protein